MRRLDSPNFSGRDGAAISLLVLHYTGMKSRDDALNRLCNPDAKVSAHYLVDEKGAAYSLVKESNCAWHAGLSYWRGARNVNTISIGIEIVNPGHEWGYQPPQPQMEAVATVCKAIVSRHAIAAHNIVAHSDIAPDRKEDPGELFDWQWLAQQGVGVWPQVKHQESDVAVPTMQAALAQYGYDIAQSGVFDEATRKVAIAFQRHFRPKNISGTWDAECASILHALIHQG